LQKSRKSTAHISGIFVCSLFFILIGSFGFSAERSYEAQFFTNQLHNKLDFARLERTGIKRIVYRVFWDDEIKGGLYFTNSRFRTIEPSLEQLIEELRVQRSGLELCAWMIGRKFKWVKNTGILDYKYENGRSERIPKLDIFNPEALQKLIDVFRELASKKIGCILIQDDFTLRFNEGFSSWGKAKFTDSTQVPAREKLMMQRDTPYNKSWKRVKIKQLNKVLQWIVQSCKRVNSGIKIGINIYYETPVFTKKAENWYSHNLRKIMNTGIDYIYLMSYHRQIKQEMKLSESKNRQMFRKIVSKAYDICKEKLIVKIQTRDWETSELVPVEEIKAYLALIPPQVKRICFTPITPEDYDYLQEIIGGAGSKR
jgi:biofilm PGA synthesis lipoprotein PgaB